MENIDSHELHVKKKRKREESIVDLSAWFANTEFYYPIHHYVSNTVFDEWCNCP